MSRRRWAGLAVTLGALFALSAAAVVLPMPAWVRELYETVQRGGAIGASLFVVLLIASVVVPPLPTRPLILSAGVLFEPAWGLLLVLVSLSGGASINFLLARAFGARWLRNKPEFRNYLREVELLGKWQSIVLLRLLAGFTFDWYSYFAGLLRIRFRTYVLATIAGTVPRVAVDVYAGNFLVSHPWLTLLLSGTATVLSLTLLARHTKVRHIVDHWKQRPKTRSQQP